jgi:hypothetical protein
MKDFNRKLLLCVFLIILTYAAPAGEMPSSFVRLEMQAFKTDLKAFNLDLDPDAESAISQFITVTTFTVETEKDQLKARHNVEMLFGGLIYQAKNDKEKSVTLRAFEKVRNIFCPGLWPFC